MLRSMIPRPARLLPEGDVHDDGPPDPWTTIRRMVSEAAAAAGKAAGDHAKAFTDVAEAAEDMAKAARSVSRDELAVFTDPRGPHRHRTPAEQRELADAARWAAYDRLSSGSKVLADLASQARDAMDSAMLPQRAVDPARAQALGAELRMVLDGTDARELGGAMLSLLEESGPDSDEAALLSSSWGRRYARSRGVPEQHDAVTSWLRQHAAESGEASRREAATAARLWGEHQVPGLIASSLSLAGELARDVKPLGERPPAEPPAPTPWRLTPSGF